MSEFPAHTYPSPLGPQGHKPILDRPKVTKNAPFLRAPQQDAKRAKRTVFPILEKPPLAKSGVKHPRNPPRDPPVVAQTSAQRSRVPALTFDFF
jgi:hypothetical protein